eukprot:459605-Prymnesium_polylepis.2
MATSARCGLMVARTCRRQRHGPRSLERRDGAVREGRQTIVVGGRRAGQELRALTVAVRARAKRLLAGAARMHDPTIDPSYQTREESIVYYNAGATCTCECGILCRVKSIACMMRDPSAALS